jgi:hypothetical protein
MMRCVFALLTAAALVVAALSLFQAGWFTSQTAGSPTVQRLEDPLASESGRRYAHNQPLHWRDVVLPR